MRDHGDLLLGHAVELDQVALRPLGDGDHAAGAPHRERHAGPEGSVSFSGIAFQAALEREVVDGDHCGHGS